MNVDHYLSAHMKLPPRLLKEARQFQSAFLLAIFFGLLVGILSIFQAREISKLVNLVFLQAESLPEVSGLILAVLAIILMRVVFVWGGDAIASLGARRVKQNLRKRLYAHIMDLGPAYLRSEAGEPEVRTGELINAATEGVEALEAYFSQYLPQIALGVLVPFAILIFVFQSDLLSGVVLLVTAPLLPLFMVLIGNTAQALTRKQWRGLSRMSAYFLDVLQGLTTLKSLGRSRHQIRVIKKVSEQYRQTTMGVLRVTFLSALALELIATLGTAVLAVEVGIRLLYGRIAFEQAFFVLLLAPEFYLPLRLLGIRFHAGMAGVEASKRIFELLDLPASQTTWVKEKSSSSAFKLDTPPSIVYKDVCYSYSDGHPALTGVTIDIPSGKTTALTGESGAGKTTLTWLLLRFLQPQSGEILVNGKRLSELSSGQWLDQLAWVPQNPYLFNDTVSANIKLARPDASEADLLHAAQMAHADEFIHQLPQGFDTVIGERGMRLSAGQAQRIALARAFLKNPPLLILDEATSHLDPEMDALLQESLARLSAKRTMLIIAHHRSTLARADQVIRLSHGQVAEIQVGKPSSAAELLASKSPPHYSDLESTPECLEVNAEHRLGEESSLKRQPVSFRLVKLLSPFAGRILLSIFLGFATIASSVGLMATAAYIISAAALHPSIADLSIAIVGVRFFGLTRGVFRYLERLVSHDVTFRLLASWRVWFYQALEPLAPARLMQYHTGDLLTRVIGDVSTLEGFYVRTIAPPLEALLVTVVMSVFLAGFGMELTWVLIVFLALAGIGLPILVLEMTRQVGPQLIQVRAQLSTLMVDGIQGLPDLLANSGAEAHLSRVDQVGDNLTRLQARMANISAMQTALGGLLANLCMLTVLVIAIHYVNMGQLAGVLLGVVVLAALMSFEAVQPLPQVAQNWDANQEAARRLYALVDASPAVSDPPEPLVLPEDTHLDIHDLSFQYPAWPDEASSSDRSEFCLSNLSFSLPKGKHIAIVGPSGAGKTTLINLLQRFWDYQHGVIQWSGNDLRMYRQEDIRRRIGTISQNTYLFSATIKENLRIAHPDATDDEIRQAVEAAQLHQFIQGLPDGYDTWIGEHGLRLSAGERQRLSIARTILKNAPLLILDEPTANLNPVTEQEVLESIQQLSQGCSTINITQHMVGLESMDEILVLQNGRIIEQGTHRELLSRQGLYRRMWELYNQVV